MSEDATRLNDLEQHGGPPLAECEECGHPVNLNKTPYYKSPSEQFWHDQCTDGEA